MGGRSDDVSPSGKRRFRRPLGLRIIGGEFKGRRLQYSGDWSVRPMRDRVREAVFNILREAIPGSVVLDIFAGTGAMGLEALSRGASFAYFIEKDPVACQFLRKNVSHLGVNDRAEIIPGDVFLWWKHHPTFPTQPHVAFCCPPYELYTEAADAMKELITGLMRELPSDSVVVVETHDRYDFSQLPLPEQWDVRTYRPSRIGFFWKESSTHDAA
ncbi:MAG: SAM-dependent methyltransferase [Thermogutta sp.]|nr:MAG: SAM-dependent methyltransferase [Thermogutta sp.]